jgi:hypothetical protein
MDRWWAPADFLLVVGVVALSVFLILHWATSGGEGGKSFVVVSADGERVAEVPLDGEGIELVVQGYQGESFIEIREGRVRMVDSACPDKLCVRTGWISRPGQSIICLPNRVVIEIKGGRGDIDVISH